MNNHKQLQTTVNRNLFSIFFPFNRERLSTTVNDHERPRLTVNDRERPWTTVIFTMHVSDNMQFTDNMHFTDNMRRTSMFTRSKSLVLIPDPQTVCLFVWVFLILGLSFHIYQYTSQWLFRLCLQVKLWPKSIYHARILVKDALNVNSKLILFCFCYYSFGRVILSW